MFLEDKFINYKQIAVIKERKLENENARLKTLIVNALVILEENGFGGKSFAINELGMTNNEYDKIMGEN